eukprot:2888910-Pleurochrysis_carterae.AAC.4
MNVAAPVCTFVRSDIRERTYVCAFVGTNVRAHTHARTRARSRPQRASACDRARARARACERVPTCASVSGVTLPPPSLSRRGHRSVRARMLAD